MLEANDTSLAAGAVHIWFATPILPVNPAAPEVPQQLSILSPQERERYSAFKFDVDRIHYLLAHSMLRQVLGQYVGSKPQHLRFSCNQYGKPFLEDTRDNEAPVKFNLTHTDGMVACAFSRHPIGLDAEPITKKVAMEIAPSVLTAPELSDLEQTPENERRRRLLEFWTLKEAFIKAIGKGLNQPLDRFWFDLSQTDEPKIHFSSGEPFQPDEWRFAQLKEASPSHEMAIATALPAEQKLSVSLHRFEWNHRN